MFVVLMVIGVVFTVVFGTATIFWGAWLLLPTFVEVASVHPVLVLGGGLAIGVGALWLAVRVTG